MNKVCFLWHNVKLSSISGHQTTEINFCSLSILSCRNNVRYLPSLNRNSFFGFLYLLVSFFYPSIFQKVIVFVCLCVCLYVCMYSTENLFSKETWSGNYGNVFNRIREVFIGRRSRCRGKMFWKRRKLLFSTKCFLHVSVLWKYYHVTGSVGKTLTYKTTQFWKRYLTFSSYTLSCYAVYFFKFQLSSFC